MERREMAFRYNREWFAVAVDVSDEKVVVVGDPYVRDTSKNNPQDAGFSVGKDSKPQKCSSCEKQKEQQENEKPEDEKGNSPRGFVGLADKVKGAVGIAKSELGIGHADDETIERRRTICKGCEHQDLGVCGKCGCYCAAKVRLKSQSCPIGEW